MTTTTQQPEVSLLRHVAAQQRFLGRTVYQEVAFEGQRFDIVAATDDDLIVIAGKTTLNDAVIEQARTAQGVSNFTIVAVPDYQRVTPQWVERVTAIENLGLGLVTVSDQGRIWERVRPSPNHDAQTDLLRAVLMPQQQDFAPAGSQHEMFTEKRAWVQAIHAQLKEYSSLRLIEADGCQPKGKDRVPRGAVIKTIEKMIDRGEMPFAEIKSINGQRCLVLAD